MERAASNREPSPSSPLALPTRPQLMEMRGRAPLQQRLPQAPRFASTPSCGQRQGQAARGASSGPRPSSDGGSHRNLTAGGRGPGSATAGSWGQRCSSRALYFSSSSDEEFEMFLTRMKTPKSDSKKSNASLKDFIDDSDDVFLDFKVKKSTRKKAQKDLQTTKKFLSSGKESICGQELQYPEALSDTEDSVFIEHSWHDSQKGVKDLRESQKCIEVPSPLNLNESISNGSPDFFLRKKERSGEKSTENKVRSVKLQLRTQIESDSSDDEFESLIERIRKRSTPRKAILSTSKTVYQPSAIENTKPHCEGAGTLKGEGEGVKTPRPNSISHQEMPSRVIGSERLPTNELVSHSQSAKTETRLKVCAVPGCFLQDLSNPDSYYVKYFKKNKEELAQKLYSLYNSTIFQQKLPEKMVITWNKKMRKTAGYCVTGQTQGPEAKRYARIELSERVCDSADRLRDTLIHEACHAATWLINGVRDGHGRFWRFYATKSAVIHPELPAVTRCHSYEINYKFNYECALCKATIGRHSKSLNTERFKCICGGQLVLSQPSRKDGTPSRTHLTPFAKYVKENYGLTKKEQHGLSHAEVMRKLSADFASKARIQDSL